MQRGVQRHAAGKGVMTFWLGFLFCHFLVRLYGCSFDNELLCPCTIRCTARGVAPRIEKIMKECEHYHASRRLFNDTKRFKTTQLFTPEVITRSCKTKGQAQLSRWKNTTRRHPKISSLDNEKIDTEKAPQNEKRTYESLRIMTG